MQEYLDRRYALAFYEHIDEKGKVEESLEELAEVVDIINDNEDLLEIIKHPDLSTSKKKELFESIFKGKIGESVLAFLLLIIEKNRILEIDGIVEEAQKLYFENRNRSEAFVETVIPLTIEERKALIDKLQKKYGKTIILNEQINEGILGGVFVRVGNEIIDGTLKTKLEEMRKLALKMK